MKTKNIKVYIKNPRIWPKILKDMRLRKAAREVASEIKEHMDTDGWDLDYSFFVTEIFYQAYGVHLENYLLYALFNKKGLNIVLSSKNGELLIRKLKKKRKIK